MTTVKDIAKQAGVSTATVSRAFANPQQVSEATRNKVKQAADKLGYAPNAIARSLRTQQAKTIVVILPDISNPFFSDIIKGIEKIAHREGYKVLIGDADQDIDRAKKYLDLVHSKQADGVLLLTADLPLSVLIDDNQQAKLPFVMVCEYYADTDIPRVHIDNEASARSVIELLVEKGHKKIACITGQASNAITVARMKGMRDYMQETALELSQNFICEGDYTLQSGYDLARQLLCLEERPSAIFCHNDEMAIGVLRCAREMDIIVPEMLSVVGFDNIPFSEYCTPQLTTVHQPRQLIGETAMLRLLDLLAGNTHPTNSALAVSLKIRETVACAPIS